MDLGKLLRHRVDRRTAPGPADRAAGRGPRGDIPVAWALGRPHAPDHRRRFLHHLNKWCFAAPNGRVQREVAIASLNSAAHQLEA
jgi:hypothetical protein